MGRTGIRGTQIIDETVDAIDLASGSIRAAEIDAQAISGQDAIDSVDTTNDMLLIYDANNNNLKKVAPTNLGVGGAGSPVGPIPQVQFNKGALFEAAPG